MANPVQALRALQEIDRDIYRVHAELQRLPDERSRREQDLAGRRRAIEEARQRSMELKVRIKEIEDLTSTQRARIRKLETEANSTRDMAVVQGCRYEIQALRRQIDDSERDALEYIEEVEQSAARIAELEGELASEQTVFEGFRKNVESEIDVARRRLESLSARRRERLDKELSPEALALYERLLQSRDGEALAPLERGICHACYMQVPPNLLVRLTRGNEVIQCPSCDRILYLD
jgi:predicted  nucleic acid-binding Zn-ribbon protein